MKNNRPIIRASVTALAFLTFLVCGTVSSSLVTSRSKTLSFNKALVTRKNALDPNTYTEISNTQLMPKIVSYTGTSLSRHLNVQFESQAVNAYATSSKDVFYVIDDARYTGERNNPFNTDVPDKTLNGYVYRAQAGSSQTVMYISNTISYGSRFIVKNVRVASNAMYQEKEYDVSLGKEVLTYDAYKNLETIYICDGIETIESGAFKNVPDTVTIKCVSAEKPAGWEDDWTDAANIEWGAALADASKSDVKHSGSTTSFEDAEDFILGYKGNAEKGFGAYPLTISYEKIHADGSRSTEYQEIPTKHQTNPYDAVGSKIYGKSNSFEITINLNKGEDIDENSYEFYNIFKAQRLGVEEKEKWPVNKINEVLENYKVPTAIEGYDYGFIPSLEGETYFYQSYESGVDKYITVASEFDTEEALNAVLTNYENQITSFNVSKDTYSTEEDLKYTLVEDYVADKYGKVYNLLLKTEEIRTNIFIQFYSLHNEINNKYEFVTYIVLDNPVDEIDETTQQPTGKLVNSRNPFPISGKTNAVRPFIYVPEFTESGGVRTPKQGYKSSASVRFNKMVVVDELLTTKYKSSSRFLNYTSVSMLADKVLGTAYAAYILDEEGKVNEADGMKVFTKGEDGKYYRGTTPYEKNQLKLMYAFEAPLLYVSDNSSLTKVETNLPSILNGDIKFRYTLTSLNMASLVVSYKEGGEVKTKELPINSPSPVIEINESKNNVISFLVNNSSLGNVDTKNIVAVGISGVTLNVHLYNSVSHNLVQNTQYLNVFGNIEVLPYSEKQLECFDANTYLIIFFVALTAIYVLATIVLFFYKKNKYKNDEFRRMRPKAYFKSAALGFLGLLLIVAAINFIVLRFVIFNSTVPTYNPIDAFVIGFAIFGAIAVGLFIKFFVSAIKLAKHRREVARLHLDKDVVDDGTN